MDVLYVSMYVRMFTGVYLSVCTIECTCVQYKCLFPLLLDSESALFASTDPPSPCSSTRASVAAPRSRSVHNSTLANRPLPAPPSSTSPLASTSTAPSTQYGIVVYLCHLLVSPLLSVISPHSAYLYRTHHVTPRFDTGRHFSAPPPPPHHPAPLPPANQIRRLLPRSPEQNRR